MAAITIFNGENTIYAQLSEKHIDFLDYVIPDFVDSVTCTLCTRSMLRYDIHKNKDGGMFVNAYNTFVGEYSDDLEFVIE